MKNLKLMLSLLLALYQIKSEAQIQGVINVYTKVTAIAGNVLTVNNPALFNIGDGVCLIQMDDNNFPIADGGNFELGRITAVTATTVTFDLVNRTYNPAGANVQLLNVPAYNNPIVIGMLTCAQYNAAAGTGGVLAFSCCAAPGSVNLYLNANIDVTGKGFAGAINNAANANGLGTNAGYAGFINAAGAAGAPGGGFGNAPGGGGAGGGIGGGAGGGALGQSGGGGGVAAPGAPPLGNGANAVGTGYFNTLNKIFMGGGGGFETHKTAGNAGNGGGIIIILADSIFGNGYGIIADGAPSNGVCPNVNFMVADHFGGGGGGEILIRATTGFFGNINLSAQGGNSNSCVEFGGGGGGGGIWVEAPLTANVAANVNGGISAAGVNVQQGGNGLVVMNPFHLDGDSSTSMQGWLCALLPLPIELLSFDAALAEKKVEVLWTTASEINNQCFSLQRGFDPGNFTEIAYVIAAGSSTTLLNYSYLDEDACALPASIIYYRLVQTDFNGATSVSKIISVKLKSNVKNKLFVSVTSGKTKLIVHVKATEKGAMKINIRDNSARKILEKHFPVSTGWNILTIDDLPEMHTGIYQLIAILEDEWLHSKFLIE